MIDEKTWSTLFTPWVTVIRLLRMVAVSGIVSLIEGTYRYIQEGTTGYTHQSFAIVFTAIIIVEMFVLWRFFRRRR